MTNPAAMPRPKSEKDTQVTLAVASDWLEEAQRIADAKSEPGLNITRADVLRMSLRRGLDVLAAEVKKGGRK